MPNSLKLFVGILALSACGRTGFQIANPDRVPEVADPVIVYADPNLISMEAATGLECPSGGTNFISYFDANNNGIFDNGETERGRTTVCNGNNGTNGSNGSNGTNGSNGYGAGILISAASVMACPTGGSTITTFVDRNNDSIQDLDEATTSFSTLCNGSNGTNGSNGSNGTNGSDGNDGQSATLSVTLANALQCPNGGVVYTSNSGGQIIPDVNVVCNGVNGTNGTNGTNGSNGTNGTNGQDAEFLMGAVGPMVSGHSYSACHHDYLFFPDPSGGDRGWLTFRHQRNGSADQGIGSTGFQVWNVDIANFALASEVGGVTYCNLTWNATSRLLTYQVVDTHDGLQGTIGSIQL